MENSINIISNESVITYNSCNYSFIVLNFQVGFLLILWFIFQKRFSALPIAFLKCGSEAELVNEQIHKAWRFQYTVPDRISESLP